MVPPPPPPPPTAISTTGDADPPSPTTHDHVHHEQQPSLKTSLRQAPLNEAWNSWSSSISSRALDPLAAAASDLADFASRHRQAALTATSDVQLAKIHAQAEQCATQALLTISEYLNRAATALDTGANTCSSELQVLTATLAAIEQRVSEAFAVSAIQSVGVDTLRATLHGDMHDKATVDFLNEEAVKVIKQPDVSSGVSTKSGRSNSHVPGLTFQSHGASSAAAATTAPTSSVPTIPKLDLTSLDAVGTPLPDLSTIATKQGSIKQQSLLSVTSNSPPPPSGGSTTAASNNLDLSMLGDVSQHATIRRKNSNISTTTGATATTADLTGPSTGLSSMIGNSIDDLAPPPPPPPGAPPMASSASLPPPPAPAADTVIIPTQQVQPAAADPRGSVRSVSGMIPTQQPPPQPQAMSGGSVRSVQGISAPVPLYASHQPQAPQQFQQQQQQQQQQQYNMQYANTQRVPSPGSHMGTYTGTGGGSIRGGQPIGLGTGVNGGYGVPPMPLPPAQYAAAAAAVPPRTQSAQGMAYATSSVAGYHPGPTGSIGFGYANQQQAQQQMGYPMQQQYIPPGGPGSTYASVNQLPPPPQQQQQYAMDPATGAPMYYASGPGSSTSPHLAPAPPPPMSVSPPPPPQQVVMARVLYPYTASEQDEMHLIPGEMIEVHVLDAGAGWARGVSVADRRRAGMFPRSYVQL
ncbi:hypothetical protein BCR44DRAFT_1440228, partial [Catenaria anguillulae PL171]